MQDRIITPEHGEWAGIAGTRANMYSFFAAIFNQRPGPKFVRRLRSFDTATFERLARENDLTPKAAAGLGEIARFIESMGAVPDERMAERLAVDWTRLFRGVAPDYGPKPPYEAVYLAGEGEDPAILTAIMEAYIDQGIAMGGQGRDRPDYIGVELDFLALLAEREAAAWGRGDTTTAENVYLDAHHFFENHLGQWAGNYCDQAIDAAKTAFYKGILLLVQNMVTEMNALQNIPMAPRFK